MRIACLLSDGFEDSEFAKPYNEFRDAGHDVIVIGRRAGETLRGKGGTESIETNAAITEAHPSQFDALFIPGGYSPDHLRASQSFVDFTRSMAEADKPILAICHGPQLLTAADAIRGRRLTAWMTVQDDLRRMGETVVDEEVVSDRGLVTSRKPDDIPAFVRESLAVLHPVPAGTR